MTIGIIGAGALGSSVARALAKVGIHATIANSRGPETLAALVKDIGPTLKAVTLAEAATADIVLVALRWEDAERVLTALPAWNGRIVIDGTLDLPDITPDEMDALSASDAYPPPTPRTDPLDLPTDSPSPAHEPANPRRFNPWN